MASKFKLQIAPEKSAESWNSEKALANALEERALFLKNYPKYKTYQNEINRMLDNAGSPENRMAVLAVLMEAKLLELHKQLRELNAILIRATGKELPGRGMKQLTSSN